MIKHCTWGSLILVGGIALAGCGQQAHLAKGSPSSIPLSTSTTSTAPSSSTTTPSSTSHPRPVPTSSSPSPSVTPKTTFVPGLGNLPTATLSGSGISVTVQHVYVVGQLVVNGQAINSPSAHVEPAVVEMTITPRSNGVILPVPSFGFATTNAIASPSHLGQVAYYAAGQNKLWSQYRVPDHGVPPRLVLGDGAYPYWVVTWIERPTTGRARVAILWEGTANGKPAGVVANVAAQPMNALSITTH